MASWIWKPTAQRLRDVGIDAEAITLPGLEPGAAPADIAAVRLEDHVEQVARLVEAAAPRPVVLVSHSYSGVVAASVADRLGDRVVGLVHVGAFLPQDGRSLIDDWGDSDEDRAQERAEIEAAGHLWHPPTRQMLDAEADLTGDDRDFLASRFTPHPGRTILDAARLTTPATKQPSTYVALSLDGGAEEAWDDAPPIARSADGWRRRHLVSGHWPMVSSLDATVELLEAEIRHYESASG